MGQKVNPHGLRVGVIKDWDSKWYAEKGDFANYLVEDNNTYTPIRLLNKQENALVKRSKIYLSGGEA